MDQTLQGAVSQPHAGVRPLIRSFYSAPMSGEDIESESLRIIEEEAPSHNFTAGQWQVVRRMIHTTADFSLMAVTRFSPDAVEAGMEALRRCKPLYVDSNMIRAGLSIPRLRSVSNEYSTAAIACHVADEDVVEQARRTGLPRSLHAVRKAANMLDGGIAVFGNAPIALLELNRLICEEGIRPALVIGMPVGFVHVVESKDELMKAGVPFVTVTGRRGGSPLAVSVIHALCVLAAMKG